MKVVNVIKSLHITFISKYINEHIVEKRLLTVRKVVKPMYVTVLFKYLKEHVH